MANEEEYLTLCALIHGEEGSGKSWLGQSTPEPRLVLDAEGGSRVPWRAGKGGKGTGIRQKQIEWDVRDEPPAEGEWQTCHVGVRDYDDVQLAYNWLVTGNHPFVSVVLDSVTEIQQRCKDTMTSGENALRIQDWDLMLIRVGSLLRQFRDLVWHPTNPLDAVVFLALSVHKNGKWRPAVQGSLGTALPGYVDLEGYLTVTENDKGRAVRQLLIQPVENFAAAKDRTHVLSQHYGPVINNPDFEEMLRIYNEEG